MKVSFSVCNKCQKQKILILKMWKIVSVAAMISESVFYVNCSSKCFLYTDNNFKCFQSWFFNQKIYAYFDVYAVFAPHEDIVWVE